MRPADEIHVKEIDDLVLNNRRLIVRDSSRCRWHFVGTKNTLKRRKFTYYKIADNIRVQTLRKT